MLLNEISETSLINIHFGNFNDLYGNFVIPIKYFYAIHSKIKQFCRYVKTNELTIYKYRYLHMSFDKYKNRDYYSKKPIHHIIENKYCLIAYDKKKIYVESFPLIDKYHDIIKRNERLYKYKNMIIYVDSEKYTVRIEFYKKSIKNSATVERFIETITKLF